MRFSEWLNKLRFNFSVRSIFNTPPIVLDQKNGFILLSMVQHRDVGSYLLAVKSFCRFIKPSRIIVVADPTLDVADQAILQMYIPAIELQEVRQFQREGIPKGGCWERLCAISDYVSDGYVIQLDADTVTVGPMCEVENRIEDNLAFTLSTEDGQQLVACKEISNWARGRLSGKDHVQLIAESRLDLIEDSASFQYARGCAGFAGYPKGSFNFERLRTVSERMNYLMPECWNEWGTEQFMSNLLIASMPGACLLPHPKYCAPHRRKGDTVFLHFIGYVRFTTPLYAKLAARVCSELLCTN